MTRVMLSTSWMNLLSGSQDLIAFVNKYNKDTKKLPVFNLECLIRDNDDWFKEDYDKLVLDPKNYKRKMGAFKRFMSTAMTDDHWKILIRWIIEWEMSLMYLNPPAPTPWPEPLLEENIIRKVYPYEKWTLDDMILDLLDGKDKELPKPAYARNRCKS